MTFDDIKEVDSDGSEYCTGRKLAPLLAYAKWERFQNTVAKAKSFACDAGYCLSEHIKTTPYKPHGVGRPGTDYRISRTGFLLVIAAADGRKSTVQALQNHLAGVVVAQCQWDKAKAEAERTVEESRVRQGSVSAARFLGISSILYSSVKVLDQYDRRSQS